MPICPISCRWMSRRSPACWPSGCSRWCRISTRCSSRIRARSRSRRRSSSRAPRPDARGIVYCSHAFHGLTYGALSLNGDEMFRNGFEPLLPDCVRIPFNDLAALEQALSLAAHGGVRGRADPGQGRDPAERGISEGRRASLPPLRHAVHRRRDPDGPRPHRKIPRRRALGHRARHGAARQGALRRPCAGRRGADAQVDLRQGVQPHGPRRGARLDLLEERSRDGGRHRDARGDEGRARDRECGAHRRAAAARTFGALRRTTSC